MSENLRQVSLPHIDLRVPHRKLGIGLPESRVKGVGIKVPVTEGNVLTSVSNILTEFGSSLQLIGVITADNKLLENEQSSFQKEANKDLLERNADVFGYDSSRETIDTLISQYTDVIARRNEHIGYSGNLPHVKTEDTHQGELDLFPERGGVIIDFTDLQMQNAAD